MRLLSNTVNVFPITSEAFGLRSDWFWVASSRLIEPSYLLMVVFLILAVAIMVLKRFENANLEQKLWNIPVIIIAIAFWPHLVYNLKHLIDTFNTFLIQKVFEIPWNGFGFPELGEASNIFWWSAESFARLIPNLAYWIIYSFYMIFVFFFALLGPIVLAKGLLTDEIENFLEVLGEITLLFLWQTMLVILVGIVMPEIVSLETFPDDPDENFYFQSFILGIMIFFVPTMTKRFARHFGSSLIPPVFKSLVAYTGIGALGRIGGLGMKALRLPTARAPRALAAHGWELSHIQQVEREKNKLERQQRTISRKTEQTFQKNDVNLIQNGFSQKQQESSEDPNEKESFINLSKKAKREYETENGDKK